MELAECKKTTLTNFERHNLARVAIFLSEKSSEKSSKKFQADGAWCNRSATHRDVRPSAIFF